MNTNLTHPRILRPPDWEMQPADQLTPSEGDYVFAKPGQIYAIYTPNESTAQLDFGQNTATYTIHWYSPKTGGQLQLGTPPNTNVSEWVILIESK